MMSTKKMQWPLMAVPAAVLLTLSACGGGGGADEAASSPPAENALAIRGTVAVGAPLAQAAVVLSCANGTKATGTTDSVGAYGISVPNATAPCLITATGTHGGQHVELMGAATSAGVANVTPMTHMIVASALGANLNNVDFSALSSNGLNNAWSGVSSLLQGLGIQLPLQLGQTPLNVPFNASLDDKFDQALEALQKTGLTPARVQELANSGKGLQAFIDAAKNLPSQDIDAVQQALLDADRAQRAACYDVNNPLHGSCWRVQSPSSPQVQWSQLQDSRLTIGDRSFGMSYGADIMQLEGFGTTFSTEGGFTVQACSPAMASTGSKLQYQLISPRAELVGESEWTYFLDYIAKEWQQEGGLRLTIQQDCTVMSGEDPALTHNFTSKEAIQVTIKSDGAAQLVGNEILSNGEPNAWTQNFTSENLRDWLFRGKALPSGDDKWDTFAQLYKYDTQHDGHVYAISFRQVPHAGATADELKGLTPVGLLIEWDGYK